jgi:hypothetical protein
VLAESGSFRAGSSRFGNLLRRCEGFRVDSPNGRVGFVAELPYGSSLEEPDAIAVRAPASSAGSVLIVPAGEIEEIVPSARRVLLRRRRDPRPPADRYLRPPGGRREVEMAGPIRAMTGRAAALLRRLARHVPLIGEKGGERAMTPETEAPAEAVPEPRKEAPAEEPTAEATEEAAAEEAPAEEAAIEEAPAEEPTAEATEEAAAEEAPAEEAAAEEAPAEEPTAEATEEAAAEEAPAEEPTAEEAPAEEPTAEATEEAAAEESSEPTE